MSERKRIWHLTLFPRIVLMAFAMLPLAQSTDAAQNQNIRRIGWLSVSQERPVSRSFIEGLQELGWHEGKNIIIERRFAKGQRERLSSLAAELVEMKVDVIVAANSAVIAAAQNATKTTPIVMTVISDPVARGFAESLARPGGNITGLSNRSVPLGGKRLELLRETAPTISRVAALGPSRHSEWKELARVSSAFGIHLNALQIKHAREFYSAFNAARTKRVNGLVVLPSAQTNSNRTRIINFAAENKVPAMYPLKIYAVDGGLMSYGPDLSAMQRRAAYYVDKILRGTKPSDLPIEQPNRPEFVINLKAAKQIGLTIHPSVLARADKVIK